MTSLCNDTLLRNGYVAFEIAVSKYFISKDFLFPLYKKSDHCS